MNGRFGLIRSEAKGVTITLSRAHSLNQWGRSGLPQTLGFELA